MPSSNIKHKFLIYSLLLIILGGKVGVGQGSLWFMFLKTVLENSF